MKRWVFIPFIATLMLWPFAPPAGCQDAPKALIFIRDGSEDLEFMLNREANVMKRVLEEAGIQVEMATASGDPIVVGSINYTPDLALRDADLSEYAAFLLPCMAVPPGQIDSGAVEMVKEAAAAGKVVAAQFVAMEILAEAGVLSGKEYAWPSEIDTERRPAFEGAKYAGSGVVRDGNVVTSSICPFMARQRGVPEQTEEFTQAVVDAIKG